MKTPRASFFANVSAIPGRDGECRRAGVESKAMTTEDPFASYKQRQREAWASFAPTALFTTPVAAHIVRFAAVAPGESVLDVGTGTGVAAITAARAGATVKALDLTPELLDHARANEELAGLSGIEWTQGDAESLPYPDGSFDVVLSQFAHIFAPRPERTVAEIRRVLKDGGRVAFATWPPEHLVGRTFGFLGRHSPPPPPGFSPPSLWGDPAFVSAQLAAAFEAPIFERGAMYVPALSVAHYRTFIERSIGPMQRVVESLADAPERLAALRAEFEEMAAEHYVDNVVEQAYLLTRAAVRSTSADR